jgi:uncharacterized protein
MRREILTSTGVYFNFDELNVYDLTIEDIAHSLAHICRFTGHCRRPAWWPFSHYSVAQHSVLVSHLVPAELAYDGLMHDINEALMNDVATPLKQMLLDYKRIETRVERSLFQRFDVIFPVHPLVKAADARALLAEKRDLMHPNAGKWTYEDHFSAAEQRVRPWPIWYAKYRFLKRYRELRELGEML